MEKLIIELQAIDHGGYINFRFCLNHVLNEIFGTNVIYEFERNIDKISLPPENEEHPLIIEFNKLDFFLPKNNNRNFDVEFKLFDNSKVIFDVFYKYLKTKEIEFTVKKINFISTNLLCVNFPSITNYHFSTIISTLMKEEDRKIKDIDCEINFEYCSFENEPIWLTGRGVPQHIKNSEFNNNDDDSRVFFPFFKDLIFNKKVTFKNCNFGKAINELVNNKNKKNYNISTEDKIDFSNCIFKGEVSFDDSIFNVNTLFNKTKFENEVSFKNTKFIKLVDFYGSSFNLKVTFKNCNFGEAINELVENKDTENDKISNKDNIDFRNCVFKGGVSFDESIFNVKTLFNETKFENEVSFKNTKFIKLVDFYEASFNLKVTFYNCDFREVKNELVENKDSENDKIANKDNIDFSNCVFKGEVSFDESIFNVKTLFHKTKFKNEVSFKNIKFIKLADFSGASFTLKVTFYNCYFGESINELVENKDTKNDKISTKAKIDFSNCVFEEEVSFDESTFYVKTLFHETKFEKKVSFKNTKFIKLVDFYGATFNENTVFYKTAFEQKVVFVETTFKENVLFTYSTIHKMILRETKFEKGFDFSICSSIEALQIFNIEYNNDNFITEEIKKEEVAKGKMSINVKIPLKNKIETYRIFKHQLNKADNFLYALDFKRLELKTYSKQEKLTWYEWLILNTSKWSNDFDNNFPLAILWLFLINLLFTYLTLIFTESFNFSCPFNCDALSQSIKIFLLNFNPTHSINEDLKGLENGLYLLDFFGRIIKGYLIYQIIQAFRKYRNK